MEQSLSMLTFKGSIMEAIAEAKQQKKLFLVYISAGSADAANFSAIYPQKSPPCITAVGYNGVLLWQYDGFFTADVLASSIEKSWLSLHIQETTATYFAAFASKNQPTSETSASTSTEQGSLPSENGMSSPVKLPEVGPVVRHEKGEETSCPETGSRDEKSTVSAESSMVDEIGNSEIVDVASSSRTPEVEIPDSMSLDHTQGESVTQKEILSGDQEEKKDYVEIAKNEVEACRDGGTRNVNVLEPTASISSDAHLNIRLPDGSSLQMKLSVTDPLRKVKDYVDENQTSSLGQYDLATPYPRKVFGDKDLTMTLQELNLFGRQTLIVVQHGHSTSQAKLISSSHGQTNFHGDAPSSGDNSGYWTYVRRFASFFNPFSYLGGGASSHISQDHRSSMLQYSVNPSAQNNLRASGRSYGVNSSNQSTNVTGRSSSRPQTRPPFGSNIHTLNRDEDDNHSGDRNTWNGNSTQFGGDSDDK